MEVEQIPFLKIIKTIKDLFTKVGSLVIFNITDDNSINLEWMEYMAKELVTNGFIALVTLKQPDSW